MKIEYIESENAIEIKDGLKNQYLIIKILMGLNIGNAIIRLFGRNITEYGTIEYFWIGIGMVSLVILFFFLFKKSTAKKINVSEIDGLKEKSFFGTKRFDLELKNGKNRTLGKCHDEFELTQIHELFTKLGIKN